MVVPLRGFQIYLMTLQYIFWCLAMAQRCGSTSTNVGESVHLFAPWSVRESGRVQIRSVRTEYFRVVTQNAMVSKKWIDICKFKPIITAFIGCSWRANGSASIRTSPTDRRRTTSPWLVITRKWSGHPRTKSAVP